ncbi:MAG: ABC transporter ATP-binding protein [Deltaproteobacteria bacterium]|nr:ABC transporter ATP-binding protein [Deltaproteobacteria bacterium]
MIEAEGLGVKYILGSRREDIQSRTYDVLFWRWQRREFWALRDLHLVGYPGDMLGIIGVNGSGKTTLCRVLTGLLRPDEGGLSIKGQVYSLLSFGAGFNDQFSGRENIFLKGLMLGLSRQHLTELFPEIVEFSGLQRFIDEPLKHYSTGMKTRLGFSIAAVVEPDILILDEVLSGGDLEFNEKAGQKMQELISKSKMVIVVTHQMDFAKTYCTRVAWLDGGRVRAAGHPDEVVQRYRESIPPLRKRTAAFRETRPRLGTARVIEVSHLEVKFSLLQNWSMNRGRTPLFSKIRGSAKASFWALEDVSFTVRAGDIVGVIGPNGAGKSTLCRVLSGILRPDRGKVWVDGETTALLTFGAGFNGQLTGRDNVYLNGMMLGIAKKRLSDLYPAIVEFSGLAKFMDEPVKHYSRGMKVRLGFSIAAMIKPDILIIDEALSAGDLAFYEKASAKIQELIAEAKAVLVVTHNLTFVETICTRALWLDKGRIRFEGNPKEAVTRYRQSHGLL